MGSEMCIRDSIGSEDLKGISADLIEMGVDSILDEGVLKEIPIVSFITRTINLKSTITDKIFTKKLLHFLHSIKDVPLNQRTKVIEKIDSGASAVGEWIIRSMLCHESRSMMCH